MTKYVKTEKTKVLWIQLPYETILLLKKESQKRQLSISCIAKCLYLTFYNRIPKENQQSLQQDLIFKNQKLKATTIKPKILCDVFETSKQKTTFLSNMLYLYANKKLKTISSDTKSHESNMNHLNNMLNKEIDHRYNYNEQKRLILQILKEKRANQ